MVNLICCNKALLSIYYLSDMILDAGNTYFIFFNLFLLLRATRLAYGSSQARGQIGAVVHSNARS